MSGDHYNLPGDYGGTPEQWTIAWLRDRYESQRQRLVAQSTRYQKVWRQKMEWKRRALEAEAKLEAQAQ